MKRFTIACYTCQDSASLIKRDVWQFLFIAVEQFRSPAVITGIALCNNLPTHMTRTVIEWQCATYSEHSYSVRRLQLEPCILIILLFCLDPTINLYLLNYFPYISYILNTHAHTQAHKCAQTETREHRYHTHNNYSNKETVQGEDYNKLYDRNNADQTYHVMLPGM